MKSSDCDAFLMLLGTDPVIGVDWVRGSCPLAPWRHVSGKDSNPSFGIEIQEGGISRWHCFTCQQSGDLMDLLLEIKMLQKTKKVPGMDLKHAMEIVEAEHSGTSISVNVIDFEKKLENALSAKKLVAFDEQWISSFWPAWNNPVGRAYMQTRNVSKGTTAWLEVRYDTTQQRVCFPVRGFDGACYGLHGRDVTGQNTLPYYAYAYKGHRNPDVWMNEVNCNLGKPIVLTEGPFDMASISRVTVNVMCSMTASLSYGKLDRIRDAIKIVSFYDWGTGGDLAREKLVKFCTKHGIPLEHIVPTEEEGDAGEMEAQAIVDYLSFDTLYEV